MWFLSHPQVQMDPETPVPWWGLSGLGRARARSLAGAPFLAVASSVWSSSETKARETARLIARADLPVFEREDLGENDRSATGFVAPPRFEQLVESFFAHPQESVAGWATAADEQRRITAAVDAVLTDARAGDGDVVIVAHGGVGTLLLCALLDQPITRELDQPSQGHFFAFDRDRRQLLHRWRPLEDLVEDRR